eukprot:498276-Ditylum_brightwellii.AAC.1
MYHREPRRMHKIFDQVPNQATLFSPTSETCTASPEMSVFTIATKLGRMLHKPPQTSMREEEAVQTNQEHTTYNGFLAASPYYIKRMLGNLSEENIDPLFWIKALNNSSVMLACGGSIRDGKGSYAAVLTAGDHTLQFHGLVFCQPTILALYRAELSGILALHYLIQPLLHLQEHN